MSAENSTKNLMTLNKSIDIISERKETPKTLENHYIGSPLTLTNLCIKHVMSCHTELSENANHFNWEETTTTRYPFQPKSNVLSTNLFNTEGHCWKLKQHENANYPCKTIQHLQILKETLGTTVEHASVFSRGTLRFAVLKALAVTLPGGWGSSWKSELRPIERGDDFSRVLDLETLQVGVLEGSCDLIPVLARKGPWMAKPGRRCLAIRQQKLRVTWSICRLGQN